MTMTMSKNLYIVGASSDREAMEALQPQFEAAGYDITVACPDSDAAVTNQSMEADVVVLWLSKKTGQQVYEIAKGRSDRNATSVNIFAEPMMLTSEQRNAIGHNRSVFAAVTPDVVKESVGLLGQPIANTATATASDKATAAGASEKTADKVAEANENKISATVAEAPVENVVVPGPTSSEETNTDDSAETSPFVGLLMIVGTFIALVIVANAFEFKVDDWSNYICTAIAFVISMVAVGGVINWRGNHDSSIFSTIVLTLGWLSLIFYIVIFCKDLFVLIFN